MSLDTIESSGHPLAFKVHHGKISDVVRGCTPSRDVFRVEARMMFGHQKEVLVTEGDHGTVWRLTSDESAILKGTDLAPFPLAFFNAGLHADFVNRVMLIALSMGVVISINRIEITNQYYFQGSFFRGTGEGKADAVTVHVDACSDSPRDKVEAVLNLALIASPAHAAMAHKQRNTFALYVNGRRCPVTRVAGSSAPDATDPFVVHRNAPIPLEEIDRSNLIIERITQKLNGLQSPLFPAEGLVSIVIPGISVLSNALGLVATTVKPQSGHAFCITCDERADGNSAPSGLACIAASIAFCFMTQFSRYIEHRKHKVRAIRFIQTLPFTLVGDALEASLVGGLEPVDTHVFLNADEPDEVMQNLLEVAENTCYLHAALRNLLPSQVSLCLNADRRN